jgi:uncharacterized protein YqgC (DUF456 family)
MEIFWIALTVTVMLVGLAGTFVPVLPGIPLYMSATSLMALYPAGRHSG